MGRREPVLPCKVLREAMLREAPELTTGYRARQALAAASGVSTKTVDRVFSDTAGGTRGNITFLSADRLITLGIGCPHLWRSPPLQDWYDVLTDDVDASRVPL